MDCIFPLAKADPKGLIREAYRIDGICLHDCRSIFLDWALSIPDGTEPAVALRCLFDAFAVDAPDHPMTLIIREGLEATPMRQRRGRDRRRAV